MQNIHNFSIAHSQHAQQPASLQFTFKTQYNSVAHAFKLSLSASGIVEQHNSVCHRHALPSNLSKLWGSIDMQYPQHCQF
jgi:hypothetical protein